MKKPILLLAVAIGLMGCGGNNALSSGDEAKASLASDARHDVHIRVRKAWDANKHCAFTSIIKFNGRYYLSFREADSHIFDDDGIARGGTRILVSDDGDNWTSVAHLLKDGYDLRDPKLSITPDGRLMVIIGGSIYNPATKHLDGCKPQVSFSSDGVNFTDPQPVEINSKTANGKDWIWRVDWLDGVGYGVCYSVVDGDPRARISLLKTTDGIHYSDVANFNLPDFPNEATVRFLPDKRMLMMVREDANHPIEGYWGISNPPYTDWEFKKLGFQVGGPDFIVTDDNTVIAGTRSYFVPGSHKTVLMKGTIDGKFQEVCFLPSSGDTSYPGFLVEGDELWVSYYSTHATPKAAVYVAKMPLSMFK
ncbi:MAG: hypothetical protein Q4E55_08695 [Bacteroidales bacterium]|nr:hypothetical protein [Bacteroidales bacterium]